MPPDSGRGTPAQLLQQAALKAALVRQAARDAVQATYVQPPAPPAQQAPRQ